MKKDLDKILSRTLLTYSTILFVIFVLKMFGFNYFELDTNNKIINSINNFILNCKLENVWYFITLYINTFIVLAITCNDNSKNIKIFAIITTILGVILKIIKSIFGGTLIFIFIDLLYLFMLSICYIIFVKKAKIHKYNITNYWFYMFICFIYQLISIITRNVSLDLLNNFIISNILSLDYLVLSIMSYKLYFIIGGENLCGMVLGYFSDLLISLKSLPRKLQTSYQSSKPKTTEDELADRIYLILFWLYNFFTVAVVLLIATLNDTFIECIFILSSFWINKGAFGKAFHLKKASTCFIVSSLSYYVLNRLTWKIGISFLIPVILGIALSYITSLFMNKNTKLYKGMSEEDLYKTVIQVTNDPLKIKICKEFYCDRLDDRQIANINMYSIASIRKKRQDVNKALRNL